jgi:signal transduction histidine kinase
MTDGTRLREAGSQILIVDDVADNLDLLGSILSEEGFPVLAAAGGEHALAIARARLPDLVLLDIVMPGMDGFEVCARLKADEATAGIPVLFLSARSEAEDLVKAFTVGGADYVTKPFRRVELVARVRTQLEISRTRDALLVLTRERERERIALDLHDTLAQELAAANMHAQLLVRGGEASGPALLESLGKAIAGLRTIAWDLRPPCLRHQGLAEAMEEYSRAFSRTSGIEVRVEIEVLSPLSIPDEVSINLFRIFQEALANAQKHSGAGSVSVVLGPDGGRFALTVEDDGSGFDADEEALFHGDPWHSGISGMRERAALIRGSFELRSAPGEGTRIRVEAPHG